MRIVWDLAGHHFSVFPDGTSDERTRPHMHHFHQLDMYLEGEGAAWVDGLEPFRTGRGAGVLIPPLCNHQYRLASGLRLATFKVTLSPRCWRLFGNRARRFAVPDHILALVAEVGWGTGNRIELRESVLMAVAEVVLWEVSRHGDPASGPDGGYRDQTGRMDIWPVLEQLHADPRTAPSVSDMALQVGLSSDHFSRLFAAATGEPPRQYILGLRMRSAAEELFQGREGATKRVAARYGYSTVHAFSRAFKRVFGMGPAAYRRQQTHL